MAFSSYIGSTRRGGWANSLLPSSSASNPKSKLTRKPRRRLPLRDFIFANFFVIGISISLFFFLIVFLRYGVPTPLSSHFKSKSPARFSKPRKPVSRKTVSAADADAGATVDLTTKDLYDKIDFSDVEGGPWKQGWRVSYKGDEWDSEKLKVIVVPHSHNDPGWKLTVEEYYDVQSRHICKHE